MNEKTTIKVDGREFVYEICPMGVAIMGDGKHRFESYVTLTGTPYTTTSKWSDKQKRKAITDEMIIQHIHANMDTEIKTKILKNYTREKEEIKNAPGTWSSTKYSILKDGVKVGEYTLDYHGGPFLPFSIDGKEYALYTHHYETSSIMSLPDCKPLADCDGHFCPVDFSIRDYDNDGPPDFKYAYSSLWAVVCGCVWGDDSGGWKLEALDLSRVEEGILTKFQPFGYCELSPSAGELSKCISWDDWGISLPLNGTFRFGTNKEEAGFLGYEFEDLKMYRGKSWKNHAIVEVENKDVES